MARSRNITKVENGLATVEATMKDGDKEIPIVYTVPATPNDFKKFVASLPDVTADADGNYAGPLHDAHQAFWSGLDLKLRADLRESAVAESTIIMVDKKPVDLMTLPVPKIVMAINGVFGVAAATGKDPQNAFVVARRKLIENGTLTEKDGMVAANPNKK